MHERTLFKGRVACPGPCKVPQVARASTSVISRLTRYLSFYFLPAMAPELDGLADFARNLLSQEQTFLSVDLRRFYAISQGSSRAFQSVACPDFSGPGMS